MRVVMFYHSLISDWNHGNAHFLRGIVSELGERGHAVEVYEPADAGSVLNLLGAGGGWGRGEPAGGARRNRHRGFPRRVSGIGEPPLRTGSAGPGRRPGRGR